MGSCLAWMHAATMGMLDTKAQQCHGSVYADPAWLMRICRSQITPPGGKRAPVASNHQGAPATRPRALHRRASTLRLFSNLLPAVIKQAVNGWYLHMHCGSADEASGCATAAQVRLVYRR